MFSTKRHQLKLNKLDDDGNQPGGTPPSDDPTPPEDDTNDDPTPPGEDDQENFDSLPEWAKKEIKGLRSESAKNRTKSKDLETRFSKLESGLKTALGIEDEEEDPAEVAASLQNQNSSLELRNVILGLALENGIGGDQLEYFEFLIGKGINSLDENEEELSDEAIKAIVQKVKGQGQGPADSSVDDDQDQNPPGDGNGGESGISLEEFTSMSVLERSNLYTKDPTTYNSLFKQAKAKNLI